MDKQAGPYLKFVIIQANSYFFDAIEAMHVVFRCEAFTEYKHHERQMYVRVPNDIKEDEYFRMYIEPQVNLSRSLRYNTTSLKIQLTIVPYENSRLSLPVASKMNCADFIAFLRLCDEWNETLETLLVIEPEFDFNTTS